MKPIAAIPLHDPAGIYLPHVAAITPQLRHLFSRVVVAVTANTQRRLPAELALLERDPLFQVVRHERDMPVGAEFLALYTAAAADCAPEQVLHLCHVDRVAYALQSEHRAAFVADVAGVGVEQTPLTFARSERAWQSHPRNYRLLEQVATDAGEYLFGKRLDFAWCHLVVTAEQLRGLLPGIQRRDMSMVAEFTLALRESMQTRAVDWLAWEDPFILGQEPAALKAERESDPGETRKRLGYMTPILQLLCEYSAEPVEPYKSGFAAAPTQKPDY